MPHAQSSGLDIGLTCGGRQSNLCLQQMVTVVTVRAKHGPRQPSSLLKLVLGEDATSPSIEDEIRHVLHSL